MRFRIDYPIRSFVKQWENQPAFAWALSILWVVLIGWFAFIWKLGAIGLVDETEPLFAEAARQMTVTGDWITPYFNGETRFDKPPLIYWLMAIAYQTIGVNELAARLPSALAAIALMGLGFYTLRRFGFPSPAMAKPDASDGVARSQVNQSLWWSAWIGSALIALNPETLVWARTGVSDMLLSGCMGIALLSFFCGYCQPETPAVQSRWFLSFYIFTALAVLAKGPVGVVLPGLIILVFLLYVGQVRMLWREMRLLRGGLLFLLITLPWYVLVILTNGEDYIESFFGYHNFERFTRVVNDHSAPWYFYFVVVFIGFLPWSVYLPSAIARLRIWRPQYWQQQPRTAQLGLFALIWFGVIFGFFTIAVTKLPSYVLPLMPAAAILVGLLWSEQMARSQLDRGVLISSVINVGLLILLGAAVVYSANWMGDDPAMPNLPQAIRQSGVLIGGGCIWFGAAIVSALLLLRHQGRWLWSVSVVAFLAFLVFAMTPAAQIMDSQRQLPLRQLASTIVQSQRSGEEVIMIGFEKPSLVFYTQQPILYLPGSRSVFNRIRRMSRHDPSLSSVLILGYADKIDNLELEPDEYQLVAEALPYELIRVAVPVTRDKGEN